MTLSPHLLMITLGPVQEFIAQARRSRDLWYGSLLLSEVSRAAARALRDEGCLLVFPALIDEDLAPDPRLEGRHLLDETRPPPNVVNKLLVTVPAELAPAVPAQKARDAATSTLLERANRVKELSHTLLANGIQEVWDEQLQTFLEFGAVWTPLDASITEARQRLEQSLSGRKMLRDFPSWKHSRPDARRSSLDGARESVLISTRDRPRDWETRYHIGRTEELDAVGLLKRRGGTPGQFLPVPFVALSRWMAALRRELENHQKLTRLSDLMDQCQQLKLDSISRIELLCLKDAVPETLLKRPVHLEAQVFLPDRWGSLLEGTSHEKAAQNWGEKYAQPLLKLMREPFPYVACLVADGDRMGRALNRLESEEQLRRISRKLSEFAQQARHIVEQEFHGSLVYAGGDDVLAFVCLPDALECAKTLSEAFSRSMKDAFEVAGAPLPKEEEPTLSVGLGIGHLLEDLGALLELGREAETLAKGDGLPEGQCRNALGIVLARRSGGKTSWRAQWASGPQAQTHEGPVARLLEDVRLLRGPLSTGKLYELEQLACRLPSPALGNQDGFTEAARQEIIRILSRTQGRGGDIETGLKPGEVGLEMHGPHYEAIYRELCTFVERIKVARTFGSAKSCLQPRLGDPQ